MSLGVSATCQGAWGCIGGVPSVSPPALCHLERAGHTPAVFPQSLCPPSSGWSQAERRASVSLGVKGPGEVLLSPESHLGRCHTLGTNGAMWGQCGDSSRHKRTWTLAVLRVPRV